MKTCTKCKQQLDDSEFYKRSDLAKIKLRSNCKKCIKKYDDERKDIRKKYGKRYYEKNKKQLLIQDKIYYKTNREKKLKYQKEYNRKFRSECSEYSKKYRERNMDRLSAYSCNYRNNNREKAVTTSKIYYANNKEKINKEKKDRYKTDKNYREKLQMHSRKSANKHKDKGKERGILYREKNRDKIAAYQHKYCRQNKKKMNAYQRKRRNDNIEIKINENMKNAINGSLNGRKNGRHWESLIDFTCKKLMTHLESQFTKEMTWKNYGSYWHIDHIIPLNCFNFKSVNEPEFKMAWCLDNLQPLERKENLKKHDRLNPIEIFRNDGLVKNLLWLLTNRNPALEKYSLNYMKENLEKILDENGFKYIKCC